VSKPREMNPSSLTSATFWVSLAVANVLASGIALFIAEPARAGQTHGTLHVEYGLLACAIRGDKQMPYTMDVSLAGLTRGKVYHQKFGYKLPNVSVGATFSVVPDAYYVGARSTGGDCQVAAGETAVVLPGHTAVAKVDLVSSPVIGDAPAASYLAGLVDPGVTVSLYSGNVGVCSSRVELSKVKSLDLTQSAGTYEARLSNSDVYKGSVVLVLRDSVRSAVLRLPIKPNGGIGSTSTYLRFDATRTILNRYKAQVTSLIECL
jgi:hypothetical protein